MKIAIDARFLSPEGLGIGTYTDNLLSNLIEIDNKNEYTVLLRRSNFHLINSNKDNFKKILVDAHWYSAKEQLLVPLALFKENPDLVHFLHFNVPLAWNGKFVVTIHDLTLNKYARQISASKFYPSYLIKKFVYENILKKAVAGSEKIITPSSFVKKDILKHFKLSKDKVIISHEAVDDELKEEGRQELSVGEKKKVLSTYGVKEPFILTVGNSYPYKNIGRILEALKVLPADINLVHVSRRDTFSDGLIQIAKEQSLGERFKVTGFVPREDLIALYKSANVFAFPSFSEGFGLPGLEAMALGCPVACSDTSVFREVYGEAVLYFDPNDSGVVAKVINNLLKNQALREKLVRLGFRQARKYSWRKLAKQTLEVYNSLL
jgi:glycosyltransferase involved in cell wall biosynthesis